MPSNDDRLKINLVFGVRDQNRFKEVIEYFNKTDKGYRNTEAKELLKLALSIKNSQVTTDIVQTNKPKENNASKEQKQTTNQVNQKLLSTISKWSK